MIEVPLSQGKLFALIDDVDAWVLIWKWSAKQGHRAKDTKNELWYATRTESDRSKPKRRNGRYPRKTIYLHKVILEKMGITCSKGDHVNSNSLDDRRENLRGSTQKLNTANKRVVSCGRKRHSQYKGVTLQAKRKSNPWQSQIKHNRRNRSQFFATEIEAARAYDEMARKLFGRFAKLNFPRPDEQGCLS